MAFRTVSYQEAKNPEDAKAVVVGDTGGACIPTGVVKEVPGGFAVEVFSTDGLNDAPLSAGRQYFFVKSWDSEKGRGVVEDRHRVEYVARASDLTPECGAGLHIGQRVSATVSHQFNLAEVFPEPGPSSKRHAPGALSDAQIDEQIRLYSNQ